LRRGISAKKEEVNRVKGAQTCYGGAAVTVTRGRLIVAINSDDAPYIERYAPVIAAQGRTRARLPDELRRTYTYVDVSCRIIRANRSRRGGGLLKDDATSRDGGVNTTQKPSGVNAGVTFGTFSLSLFLSLSLSFFVSLSLSMYPLCDVRYCSLLCTRLIDNTTQDRTTRFSVTG